MMFSRWNRWSVVGALLMIFGTRLLPACDTPVYQYALENWLPDVYPLVLIHKGPLPDDLKKIGDEIETACNEGRSNAAFLALDVEATSGSLSSQLRKVRDKFGAGPLPRLVLFGPQSTDPADAIWDGPADVATIAAILDSPARREIAKRLVEQKNAAVWVMLEGTDPEANARVERQVNRDLARAPGVLAEAGLLAPVLDENGAPVADATSQSANLKFSMLRFAPRDPGEQFLSRMLLQLAPADRRDMDKTAEPVLIPVFGRGRALGALPGDAVTSESITEGCAVLAGPCACEIKAQNPGVDVLFAMEWTRAFENQIATGPAIPSLAAVKPLDALTTRPAQNTTSSLAGLGPENRVDSRVHVEKSRSQGKFLLLASGAGTLLGLLALAGLAGLFLKSRKP